MRRINKIINMKLAAAVLAVSVMASCTGNFGEINANHEAPFDKDIPSWVKAGEALKAMQNWVIPYTDNQYQMNELLGASAYARHTAYTKSNDFANSFAKFNAPDNWLNSPFNFPYTNVFQNYTTVMNAVNGEGYNAAWAKLLKVAAMHRVTDVYGPIPYTQVGQVTLPDYESQQTVYKAMFDELDEAIAELTSIYFAMPDDRTMSRFDLVYGGDFSKWVKFANSLKLRMAMRLRFVDATASEEKAQEALTHTLGVITDNSDNAFIQFEKRNPLYVNVTPYNDTCVAAEIICYMNGWNDSRRAKMFTPYQGTSDFAGLRVCASTTAALGGPFSKPVVGENDGLMWINAAEVYFLRAEAKAAYDLGAETAEALYNEGIAMSFAQYGVGGDAAAYAANDTDVPQDYVNPNAAATDNANYTAGFTLTVKWEDPVDDDAKERNLERIITQKWIAVFPLGTEAWSEQRRTGYPRLFPSLNNASTDPSLTSRGASRYPYPPQERNDNTEKYNGGVQLLGGADTYGTRVWWDVRTNKPGF